ncbi:TonB-dependent receptor domain-containing protein [Telluribacter sp. SYSU D00476]|uniref:TonB-dependent receptor domain-containing protein n=1 Tax=Telluribacter sp. SYSU D00476 TaxID=2811430 RepID=UPI001FF4FD7A|nr:TonB-dependent receptor [Telluribacter sp. SYSU D00476]
MKLYTTPLWLVCLTMTCYAQQVVKGTVRSTDGQPLAYANVLLLHAKDSTLAKGAIVNEGGQYSFEQIRPGQYLVATSMVGYKTCYSPLLKLTQSAGSLEVAPLVAATTEKQLNEVTVRTQKPLFEQQVDRLVINPASMVTAAGGSILDLLERSPGVQVDRQNGGVSMSGRQGVMVMINGKLSRLPLEALVQMLSGMNADNVEKVELITSPPAKYDAEGNAGMINIILKRKQDEGTNGSFSLMGGYGKYEKASGSINVNHNRRGVNLYSSVSFNHDYRWFDFLSVRTQPVSGELWQNRQFSDRYLKDYNGDFRIGADISVSKSTVLSVQIQSLANGRNATSYNTSSTRLFTTAQPFAESSLVWIENNHWRNLGGNVGLVHTFPKQQVLTVEADYQYYTNSGPNSLEVLDFYSTNPRLLPVQAVTTSKETDIRFWVVKADYAQPLGKNWKLESGLKLNRSDIENFLGVQRQIEGKLITDPELTNNALFYENIGALYSNVSGKLGPHTDLQGGLRAEATRTHVQTPDGRPLLDRQYLNLFPSATLSHQLSKEHALNFSFSRRISRPSYTDLTPSFFLTDPNTFYVGNINLKPSYTRAIRAGYQYKGQYFLWVGYSRERNCIFRHQPVIYPGRPELIHMVQNFDLVDILSLEVAFPITFTPWWTAQNNLSGFHRVASTQFVLGPFHQRLLFSNIRSVHTFRLGHGWTGELSVLYMSHIPAGVMTLRSRTNLVLGIQKVFTQNRGRLSLTINDLLWTNQLRWYATFPEEEVKFNALLRDAPRIAKVTYTRSFGNQKVKTASQRKGAEEEKRRVSF